MEILIIGNGFDLAHGLKTSYKDFLEYCSKTILPDIIHNESLYEKYCKYNFWMEYFISKQMGDTWIDLETEIYNVICEIFKKHTSFPATMKFDNYHIQYIDSNNIAMYYQYNGPPVACGTEAIVKFLYDQLRSFTKAFEKYLVNEVLLNLNEKSKFQLSLQSAGVQQHNQDVRVLSFNYTDTCERLYEQKFNTYCQLKIKPVYVHGKAKNNSDCDLVLGTHSFDRDNNDKDLLVDLNVFQKHNQRHRYGTIEAYQDFLRELTDPKRIFTPVFHIIGHSLDKTDHKILKHVLQARKNAVIKIYYHNEEAQEKLINNITEIIGEEEVMAKVRLIPQHDETRGLLKFSDSLARATS